MEASATGENGRSARSELWLNGEVMRQLRLRPAGHDARSVRLENIPPSDDGANWRICHFDQGQGDRYNCKIALRRIHMELSGAYDMVG